MWNGEVVMNGNQHLTGKFTSVNDNWSWHISVVYADCNRIARRSLWQELINVRNTFTGPWIVCGDFNVTRYTAERTNCYRLSGAMSEFSNFIEELELVDPPLFGGSFTWRRGEEFGCASRIDRILHCGERGEILPQIKQSILPKLISDYNPLLMTCGKWE